MKIKIHDYTWNVELVDISDPDLEGKYDGRTSYKKLRIAIDKAQAPDMIKETLLHELTHAYLGMQGRYNQRKLTIEEVCEFIGWNAQSMVDTANAILKEWKVIK